jgi:hypothetical protein
LVLASLVVVSAADARERGNSSGLVPSFGKKQPTIREKKEQPVVQRTAFERMVTPKRDATKLGESSREPSMLDKFNRNTKRALTKTKQMLTPRTKPKPSRFSLPWRKADKPREKKKSFLTSWFASDDPKPKPKTLTDWLDQPMP